MKTPCYQCQDRHVNCHSECERYAKYHEKLKVWKDKENADGEMRSYNRECVARIKRIKR